MYRTQAWSPTPWSLPVVALLTALAGLAVVPDSLEAGDIAQSPLYLTTAVPPVVMFAMSNDHQLYIKAYTDYSDIDGDGRIDTTYTDEYDYYGYFDYRKCYTYSNGVFVPTGFADEGTDNGHSCPGAVWSGNFLNWVTMTRMDILRKVIYGGKRSTDTATETILERTLLPKDVHSFAKIYKATATEMQKLTPFAVTELSFCNITDSNIKTQDIDTRTAPPLMRVARGLYENWATGEVNQCGWGTNGAPSSGSAQALGNFTVRVKVCDQAFQTQDIANAQCRPYGDHAKPFGLLQEYGEDAELPIRFGLVSGSYNKKIAGGVLRDRADQIANNPDAGAAEIDAATGIFTGNQGIITTLDAFRIVNYQQNKYTDCDTYGIDINTFKTSASENRQCRNWGNPIGEIYLETARYLAGAKSPTGAFAANDSNLLGALAPVTWDDPIRDTQWCAKSNIVLVSTADNSFDWDNLGSASAIEGLSGASDVDAKTDSIGSLEGLSGSSYVIGESGPVDSDHDVCTAKVPGNLSDATGICPGTPSLEGGFAVAGLAYHVNMTDLRRASSVEQTIQTFSIALARDIPEFKIAVGDKTLTLLPACRANNTGSATFASAGWRTCSMAGLRVGDYTDGTTHPIDAANDPDIRRDANGNLVAGRLLVHWEDSPWGNDYDLDGQVLLEFCVGMECETFETDCHTSNSQGNAPPDPVDPSVDIGPDDLMICTAAQYVQAGNALGFGFTISGSNADGEHLEQLRPGGKNFTHPSQGNAPKAVWSILRQSGTAAKMLKPPIWYAAKYGGFNDLNANGQPDLDIEWDVDKDGEADNYFLAENPAQLGPRLARFLDMTQQESSAASVAANSLSQATEYYVYQARFNSGDWSGDLVKIPIDRLADPTQGDPFQEEILWSARDVMDKHRELDAQYWSAGRNIISATGVTAAVPFRWSDSGLNAGNIGNLLNYSVVATSDPNGAARLSHIRGDGANEGTGLDFRERRHLLGDLIHSAPFFVGGPPFNYPDDLEAQSYATFKSTYGGRDGIVYVGGNDGMLHGFDDDTGREVIAYVPRALYPTLRYLTDPQYDDSSGERHRYYADASPNVKDAFIDHDGDADREWRTVLVSGLGAGGRGVFALDVTDPTAFTEDQASSILLWDISAATSDDLLVADGAGGSGPLTGDEGFEDLGYSFSEPSIVRLPDNNHGGKWAAVLGNGYPAETDLDSGTGTGKAVLYIVDLANGSLLEKIVVDDVSTDNGLSSPAAVDLDRDNRIDLIYVGDLHGNLWRIEPAADGSRWQVSQFGTGSPTPLFSARRTSVVDGETVSSLQPITVLPEVGRHPDGGQVILFGTGKYFEKNDDSTTDLQSFYGVWDYYDALGAPGDFQTIEYDDLQEQRILVEKIITVTTISDTPTLVAVRVLSDNEVTWWNPADDSGNPGKKGWYLDLAMGDRKEGERVVFNPAIEGGVLIFSTLIPSPDPCDFGGDSYIFMVDLLTGGRLIEDVFGLGLVEIGDLDEGTEEVPVSAIKPSDPIDSTIAMQPTNVGRIRGGGDSQTCGKQLYAVSTSDGDIEYLLTNAPVCAGRKSWTQMR